MTFKNVISFLALALLASVSKGEELRIAVSDLLGDFMEAPLETLAEENSFEIEFSKQGSLPAMERLASDELDIAVIAVPDGHTMPDSRYVTYPLAYDIAVLLLNENNPLAELSLESLRGVFGANERNDFNSWDDLGLSGWTGRNIKALAAESDYSISNELFKHIVLNENSLKSSVAITGIDEASKLITSDVTSIGLFSRNIESSRVKTLMVSVSDDSPAYGPSVDNIHYGDYPLRLPFYIVFESSNKERVRLILSYLLGVNCSKLITENGFYTLPETVRTQYSFELNMQR